MPSRCEIAAHEECGALSLSVFQGRGTRAVMERHDGAVTLRRNALAKRTQRRARHTHSAHAPAACRRARAST